MNASAAPMIARAWAARRAIWVLPVASVFIYGYQVVMRESRSGLAIE